MRFIREGKLLHVYFAARLAITGGQWVNLKMNFEMYVYQTLCLLLDIQSSESWTHKIIHARVSFIYSRDIPNASSIWVTGIVPSVKRPGQSSVRKQLVKQERRVVPGRKSISKQKQLRYILKLGEEFFFSFLSHYLCFITITISNTFCKNFSFVERMGCTIAASSRY